METQHRTERLSEYLDGALAPAEREEVELHLLECAGCAELLDELRQVAAGAASLDDRPPPRDLWPGIETRLVPRAAPHPAATAQVVENSGEAERDTLPLRARRGARRRVAFTLPQLLAAGIALVMLSGGAVWALLTAAGGGAVSPSGATPPAVAAAPSPAVPAVFTAAYEQAVRELETELEARRGELDPETVRVVERNLGIIDAAIAEARRALEQDPTSGFLHEHLAESMRRKVDLLRQATRIQGIET